MKEYLRSCLEKLCLYLLEKLYNNHCYDQTTISKGDVVWALMPLSDEKMMQIPPGHRIRPFVIISSSEESCKGYACSSQPNTLGNGKLQFFIDKKKYHIRKSSFVDISRVWNIPYDNIESFFYRLDNEDFQEMLKFKSNVKDSKVIAEYGKGTIIKKSNDYFLIYAVDNKTFLAYFLQKEVQSKDKNSMIVFAYNKKIYYLDITNPIMIEDIETYEVCSLITQGQLADLKKKKNEFKRRKKLEENNINRLKEINFSYPSGTIFYNDINEQSFIYLFHIKERAYGVYIDANQNGTYVLKREILTSLRTNNEICDDELMLGILFNLPVNNDMKCILKHLQELFYAKEESADLPTFNFDKSTL